MNGEDIPDPIESLTQLYADCENDEAFAKLYHQTMKKCPKQLLENFKSYKFQELTPVQMQVIPVMLNVMTLQQQNTHFENMFIFPISFSKKLS